MLPVATEPMKERVLTSTRCRLATHTIVEAGELIQNQIFGFMFRVVSMNK